MLMLAGLLPPWARNAAAAVIAAAVVWWLAGQALVRNRRKLDALWCAQGFALLASTAAMVGFFCPLFGSEIEPFHGYDVFTPDRPAALGYMTVLVVAILMVVVLLTRTTRTGLLLAALQAFLGVLGGAIWVPWILRSATSLAYGIYLVEGGFAAVVVAALWQFKVVADRMPGPPGSGAAGGAGPT